VSEPQLRVRNLETRYGPVSAIKGVSFDVAPGRFVAVLGANGAGKTTLLNTTAGIVDPARGQIVFEGEAIEALEPNLVARRGVILIPEGRQVFPFLSVRDNLRMGTFARRDASSANADYERVLEMFPRLRERLDVAGGLLSGGEQQMLAIGRGLMAQPKMLLLDEPSLGLSPILTKEMFAVLRRINRELAMTILVVEQNARIALETADDAYVMELGRIVASGTCAELSATENVREFYLGKSVARETATPAGRRATWR